MELAPVENVLVETSLKEIAGVAVFIAKMMSENENLERKVAEVISDNENQKKKVEEVTSDNENLKTKVEEVTSDNENLKRKVAEVISDNENLKRKVAEVISDNENLKIKLEDQTTDNEFFQRKVVDLTGENQKLIQEREEEIIKRKDTEEDLKLAETKAKELREKLRECRANELKNLDTISELLETNAGLKIKGREIATKAKQKIKRVTKENALLTIENELFNKFEEKRNNDGKHILEDLARLKMMATQFSFCRKRASKRELFNRIADGVKESIMSGCIE